MRMAVAMVINTPLHVFDNSNGKRQNLHFPRPSSKAFSFYRTFKETRKIVTDARSFTQVYKLPTAESRRYKQSMVTAKANVKLS